MSPGPTVWELLSQALSDMCPYDIHYVFLLRVYYGLHTGENNEERIVPEEELP